MSSRRTLAYVRHPHAGEPIVLSILDGDTETKAEVTARHALRLAGDLIAACAAGGTRPGRENLWQGARKQLTSRLRAGL